MMSQTSNNVGEEEGHLPDYEPEVLLVSSSSESEVEAELALQENSTSTGGLDVPSDLVAYLLNEEKEFDVPISKRTRANFPLTDVSIDQLDKAALQLVAPKETPWDVFRDDQEWNNFLNNLNSTPILAGYENDIEEDDDDDDFDAELEEIFSDVMKNASKQQFDSNIWELEGVQLGTPCALQTQPEHQLYHLQNINTSVEKSTPAEPNARNSYILDVVEDGVGEGKTSGWNDQLLRQLHVLASAHVQLLLHTHVLTAIDFNNAQYHHQAEILIRQLDEFRRKQIQYRIAFNLPCYERVEVFTGNDNGVTGWKPRLAPTQTQVGSVIDVGILHLALPYLDQYPKTQIIQHETAEKTITTCLGPYITKNFNPHLFPKKPNSKKGKQSLFLEEEDILLAHGIVRYGKNWKQISENILVGKTPEVIWCRAKNIQARSDGDNPVKRALNLCTGRLRLVELCIINKCIQEKKDCGKSMWEEASKLLQPYRTSEQWLAKNWRRASTNMQTGGLVYNQMVLQQVLHPPSGVLFQPKGSILPGTSLDFIYILPFAAVDQIYQLTQQQYQQQQLIANQLSYQQKQSQQKQIIKFRQNQEANKTTTGYLAQNILQQNLQLIPNNCKRQVKRQPISKKQQMQSKKQRKAIQQQQHQQYYNNNIILQQLQLQKDYYHSHTLNPLIFDPLDKSDQRQKHGIKNSQNSCWSELEDRIIMRGVLSDEYNSYDYTRNNQFFVDLTQQINRQCLTYRSIQQVQSRGTFLQERFRVMRSG